MGGRERWLSGLSGGGGEWQQPDILDAFSAREARLDALWTPVGQNHLHSSPRPATERSGTLNPAPDGLTTHIRHSKTPFLSFKIWTYHSRHIPLFENISTYCAAELYSSSWTALSASISCSGLFPTSTPQAFSGIVRQVLYKSRVLQETPSKNRQICSPPLPSQSSHPLLPSTSTPKTMS